MLAWEFQDSGDWHFRDEDGQIRAVVWGPLAYRRVQVKAHDMWRDIEETYITLTAAKVAAVIHLGLLRPRKRTGLRPSVATTPHL